MASLGQKLKDERLRQGKDLRTIADELRIGSRYLEAIEVEDWKQLPGGFFNRSFIRQYAQALGFDPGAIEQEFAALVKPEPAVDLEQISAAHDPRARRDAEKKLISVEPLSGKSTGFFDSRTGLAVAALVLLVAGGGGLSLVIDKWNSQAELRKQTNANVPAPVAPAPAAAVVKPQPAAVELPAETANVVPTVTTDPNGNLTLNIEATEKTWIEVTADGKRIFMGVLEPGDKKLISTLQRAKMVVGNAGGIAVSKGGRDIGPIGPRGQVRTVNITQEGVEIVEPKKAPGEI
ncbi:MAG: helix-turn-helix domain-containing protein [Acidobacteria bacterium]|nr:helix-turn-helix domain-containing protein [Acidobacteriota bacterium]